MTFRKYLSATACCAGIALAPAAQACCFSGEVSITPQVVTPLTGLMDETSPVLPAVIVAVLVLISSNAGSGNGQYEPEGE